MKRIFFSLIPFPLIAITAWLGGYDFDTRGFFAAWAFLMTCFFSSVIYTYPGWEE